MGHMIATEPDRIDSTPVVPQNHAFDRRSHDRHPVSGYVTLHRCDHDPDVYQYPICSIELTDMGDGGLAATSDIPLQINEQLVIYFPSHGNDYGFDLQGHVVRCEHTNEGYRVGVKFDRLIAA